MVKVFEDGFETGDFSKWNGITITTGETAKVLTVKPFRGVYHADFETDGVEAGEMCYATLNHSQALLDCYARAYFLFKTALPVAGKTFVTLDVRTTLPSGGALAYVDVHNTGTAVVWRLYYTDSIGAHIITTSNEVKLDEYYCVELHIKVSATEGTVELFINGTQIAVVTGIDNLTGKGPANYTQIGERWSDSVIAHGIYVDNFVLADAYIGPEPEIPPPVSLSPLKALAVIGIVSGVVAGAAIAIKKRK